MVGTQGGGLPTVAVAAATAACYYLHLCLPAAWEAVWYQGCGPDRLEIVLCQTGSAFASMCGQGPILKSPPG